MNLHTHNHYFLLPLNVYYVLTGGDQASVCPLHLGPVLCQLIQRAIPTAVVDRRREADRL